MFHGGQLLMSYYLFSNVLRRQGSMGSKLGVCFQHITAKQIVNPTLTVVMKWKTIHLNESAVKWKGHRRRTSHLVVVPMDCLQMTI
jgi:hypothetical protein